LYNLIFYTLKIKTILVSQPAPQNDKSPYFDLCEKYGVKIDFRSFTDVEEIRLKDFRKSKINIAEHSAVIMTSKTSIDNFFRICEELRYTVPDTMKYFCISESIAFYLQKYITYRKRKISYANGTVEDLADMTNKHKTEKFIIPLSEVHKDDLLKKLDRLKIKYSKAILYRTKSADLSDLKDVNYDILVFFSPSGIQSLFENFPNFSQNGTKIASFGITTAKAVKKAGLHLNIKAPTAESPSMAMALDNFIKEEAKKK
jgi:uroporphyrinogen-III synthase